MELTELRVLKIQHKSYRTRHRKTRQHTRKNTSSIEWE